MPVPKLTGLQATLAAKKKEAALTKQNKTEVEYLSPDEVPERIRIIFDNSTSMVSIAQEVKDGCVEFMRHCTFNQTACAIHTMNNDMYGEKSFDSAELTAMTTNLPALSILISKIIISGGTPMFETIQAAMNSRFKPAATRFIVFSDGQPNFGDPESYKAGVIATANVNKTPIDTVMISYGEPDKNSAHYQLLKELADETGGFFLVYEKGKSNFGGIFKYLSAGNRLMLANESFKEKVERGEV